jgi:hypothetical protein
MVKAVILIVFVIAVLAGGAAFMWGYGTAVPLKGIGNLKVVPTSMHGQDIIVSVSGALIDSSPGASITRVSQQRKGKLIVIVIRKGSRFGKSTTGKFSIDITVPDGVDAIAYEAPTDLLWRR